MFIIHFVLNALIVGVELGLAGALGWLAWQMPVAFAGVTGGLAIVMGLHLEYRRLAFEMPFYFERASGIGTVVRALFGSGHAIFKGLSAALVALMTFSGTEDQRLQVVAAIFVVCVLVGSTILRRITISFGAKPAHWGFFRMAVPLGLLFSAAVSFFPSPSSLDVVRRVLLDLPARPGIAAAGEALFVLRHWIDDLLVRLLATFVGPTWAHGVGVVVGSNMLAGFVLSLYAVVLSEVVRVLEETHWRMRGWHKTAG